MATTYGSVAWTQHKSEGGVKDCGICKNIIKKFRKNMHKGVMHAEDSLTVRQYDHYCLNDEMIIAIASK